MIDKYRDIDNKRENKQSEIWTGMKGRNMTDIQTYCNRQGDQFDRQAANTDTHC